MSQSIKQVFRRMNLDADVRSLKPGEYRKLLNGITVQPASSTSQLQDLISSVAGNAVVANADLGAGTNKIIGGLEDRAGNRYFFAVYNATASLNTIYQYKDGVVTRVMRSALFAFAATDFVDMDIIGDFLVFTNNNSDIKKINVVKAIAGGTYTPLKEEITFIKRPPHGVLTWTVLYDIAYANNYLAGNYFQFFHRYIYEDGEMSVFGGASKSCDSWVLPSTIVDCMGDPAFGNYTLTALPSYIDGFPPTSGVTRVFLNNQTLPKENGIWIANSGAWTRATDANSDATLRAMNLYVKYGAQGGATWKNTNSSTITVDTTGITFSLIDGPNAIDVVTDTADIPATVKQVEYAVRINGGNEFFIYRIDKTPLGSATHRFYNDKFLSTIPDSESFKWNDSISIKSKALRVMKNRVFLFNNTEGYTHTTTTKLAISIVDGDFTIATRATRGFKDGGEYNVGLVFFDFAGRFVGGVHCESTVTIPYRKYQTDHSSKITISLVGIAQADIPLDAVDYAVVVSDIKNKSFFICYESADFFYYLKDANGVLTYTKTYTGKVTGSIIDISTLTREGLGYTFNKGDRIRIVNSSHIYNTLPNHYFYIDTEILSQDGKFIFTRVISEFAPYLSTSQNSRFAFEIYTPKTATIAPFFEVGEKYPITLPGGVSRAFSLTSIIPIGDTSSVLRRSPYVASGTYLQTDPYSFGYVNSVDTITGNGKWPFEAMNSYDKNFNVWVKPGAKSVSKSSYDTIQILKKNSIRFSQPYNQLSNVLQINTFQALDEQALPVENGPGTGLAVAGEVLVAVHEVEATAVYVGQGFVNTSNGNNFLAKTESVIGDTRKYLGGHGSIHQATIVSREGVVYWLDARKGAIIRRSQDGLTRISDYGMKAFVSAQCTYHLEGGLGSLSRIVAGWDPQYDCYTISFIDLAYNLSYTLLWHEKTNSWQCITTFYPEFLGSLGQLQLAFLNGALWKQTPGANYNKFFGVQYLRTLEWEISTQSMEAIWEAIEVDAEAIYSTAGTNEAIVYLLKADQSGYDNIINYLDFRLRGSAWRSSFFRNINDASFGSTTESKYKSPHNTRGQSAYLQILYNGTDKNSMKSISVFFRPSLNTTP